MQTPPIPPKLPLALAALAAAFLGLSAAPQDPAPRAAPAAPAAELPSARSIVDRYAEATGAKAMVEKTSSVAIKGTLLLEGMGLKGTFERYSAKPSMHLEKSTIEGVGEGSGGFDGTTAWAIQPMVGTMILEGAERLTLLMHAPYDAALMPERDYEKLEVQGRESFEGHDCYKVLAVYRAPADPKEAEATQAVRTSTSWFDVESGLLMGRKATQAAVGSETPTRTIIKSYKRFGDYTLPAEITEEVLVAKVSIKVESVEFDKVDPKVFELPPAVRALLGDAKQPVPAGSGAGGR